MNFRIDKLRQYGLSKQVIRTTVSVLLALAILLLIRADLFLFAVSLAVFSKWQVLLGGPRLWLHNIWDNGADIVVLWSFIALLTAYQPDPMVQQVIVGIYLLWQLLIKPMEGVVGRGLQALFSLGLAISAIFLYKGTLGIALMVTLGWLVAYVNAYHFLVSSEESPKYLLSAVWGLVVAQLVWLFSHWLVLFPFLNGRILIPQAVIVVVALGYVLGGIYTDHLSKNLKKKRLYGYIGTLAVIVAGLVFGSEWVAQL